LRQDSRKFEKKEGNYLTRCLGIKDKKMDNRNAEDNFFHEYTEGESDTDFEIEYSALSKKDKDVRVKYLWYEAYSKARGASRILNTFADLNNKIYMFGTRSDKKP
jgi:hypothetical protein